MKKPFKDTDVGRFLKSKGFNMVLDAVGTVVPGVKILNDVKEMVIGTPEYHNLSEADQQQFQALHGQALDELDKLLADTANARAREIAINNSEHASWLVKNVVPMLALAIVLLTIALDLLVLTHQLNATENITFLVIGNANGLSTMILGYYFGSSKSSGAKDETIKKLIRA